MRAARSTALVFALCCTSACEPELAPPASQATAQPVPPPAPTLPPIGSWVRVSQRQLFMAPRADARLVVDSEQPYRLAEVLGFPSDKFVHLRSLVVRPEVLCGTSSGSDPKFHLEFFAPLDALRPVLNQRKLVEFGDGTKLDFKPGTPIDLSEDEARLQVGEVGFVVPVSSHEIRDWFPPPKYPSLGIPIQWSRDRPLHYGDRSIASLKPPFVFARAREQLEDGGELLTFADACGRYTLRAEPGPPVLESTPPSAGTAELSYPCNTWASQGWMDRRELTWATSDRVAGWARDRVPLPATAREHDGKVCFSAVELSVCMASEKIRPDERPDCRVQRESSSRVELGEAIVDPGIDPHAMYGIVKAYSLDVHRCYDAGLAKQPQLAGRLVIEFVIGLDGHVESSSVAESTLGPDEAVSTCVTKAFKRMDFSKPGLEPGSGPVHVVFPFELSPSASTDEE